MVAEQKSVIRPLMWACFPMPFPMVGKTFRELPRLSDPVSVPLFTPSEKTCLLRFPITGLSFKKRL